MDFIFFKFIFNNHGKNLLIRRSDVTLKYLRKQVRQLYRMTEVMKFALTYELINENDREAEKKHYHCSKSHDKPDKVS